MFWPLLLNQYFTNEIIFLKGLVHRLKHSIHPTDFIIICESTDNSHSINVKNNKSIFLKISDFCHLTITKLNTQIYNAEHVHMSTQDILKRKYYCLTALLQESNKAM